MMDLAMVKDYIVVAVVLMCLCIGYIIKHVLPGDGVNRYIPLILGVCGTLFNIWLCGWAITPVTVLGGLLSGLASTGLHQAFKNLMEKQ